MKRAYVSEFIERQEMLDDDYEIFHRIDARLRGVPPHSHDFYELYCPITEGVRLVVEGMRYAVKPGTMLLIAPGELHRPDIADSRLPYERIVLWMNRDFIATLTGTVPHIRETLLDRAKGRNLIAPDQEAFEIMRDLLMGLLREKNLGDPDGPVMARLMVTQLLIHLGRYLAHSPQPAPPRAEHRGAEVMRVYEYIGQHLSENLSVSRLAEMFFMDKNTLTRQFKKLTDMTPGECVRRTRLEAAHDMIAAGSSMQEACAECGFSDYSAFYRAFRRAYGAGPRAFAAREREEE